MKAEVWKKDRARLIREYEHAGITTCEGRSINPKCMYTFALSLHHLDKRSSGKAENTFEKTRLLCAECHNRADHMAGFKEFNERLRQLR